MLPGEFRIANVFSAIAVPASAHLLVAKKAEITPAGNTVAPKPGGLCRMLTGLKRQVKEGDLVPVTLMVERNDNKLETIELQLPRDR